MPVLPAGVSTDWEGGNLDPGRRREGVEAGVEERRLPLTLSIPAGFAEIIMQNPLNAESFSSLSLISHRAVHHACANFGSSGATVAGQTKPIRPIVTAAFSLSDFGDLGLMRMGIRREMSGGTNGSSGADEPLYWRAISPAAQAALLQTEMDSGPGSAMIWSITAGMIWGTTGWRIAQHEMAMSPRRACADWRMGASKCCGQPSQRRTYCQAESHKVEQRRLGRRDELVDLVTETLGETGEQIKGDDDEGPVGLFDVLLVGLPDLVLLKRSVDDVQAPLEDRCGVRGERGTRCNRY